MGSLRQDMFVVQESVDRPPTFNNSYPFANMKVNTFFFVEEISSTKRAFTKKKVMQAAYRFGRKHRMIFTSKDVPNGFQCWRVK